MEGKKHLRFDYSQTEKFWKELSSEAKAIMVPEVLPNLANLSALLYFHLPDLNWAGFYLMEKGRLVLGPFQGRTACVYIDIQRGVCGAAVRERRSQLVADVTRFPGHISCDADSRSELVIPLMDEKNEVWGVLDLDSPVVNRFSHRDQIELEKICSYIF